MAAKETTDEELKTLLTQNDKIIIKYYADWCGSCRLFKPKFDALSDKEEYKNVLFLSINAETNPYARQLAGVTNLPFVAAFKAGAFVEGDSTSKTEYVERLINEKLA